MAAAVGCGSASWIQFKDSSKKNMNKNGFRVSCIYSSSAVSDPYKTLRIQHDAFESQVKKALRKLDLQVNYALFKSRLISNWEEMGLDEEIGVGEMEREKMVGGLCRHSFFKARSTLYYAAFNLV